MRITERLDGVAIATRANVYFDGKCISHSIVLVDGSKKSVVGEPYHYICHFG